MRQKFIGQVFLDSFLTHIEQVYTGRRKLCVGGGRGVDQTVMSVRTGGQVTSAEATHTHTHT